MIVALPVVILLLRVTSACDLAACGSGAPVADGHCRRRPRFLGRSISSQHRSFQRGHRLHSTGHHWRAAAAQRVQVSRVFSAKLVREMGASGRLHAAATGIAFIDFRATV